VLGGVTTVKEYFFIWEEGVGTHSTSPRLTSPLPALAEDYVVEPDGPDRCRFTWTVALEPTPLGRLGGLVNSILFKRLFAETRRHFHAG
jgi:hypothetical protein